MAAPVFHFGPFVVTAQVFYSTASSFALVNLKPILPGHVLVCPRRLVPRVADLSAAETSDLFLAVRRVGRMVERVYGASSLNIAIQDGVDAGQSVAHVHAHVIPRRCADLAHCAAGTDAVYEMLDGEEGNLARIQLEAAAAAAAAAPGTRSRFLAVDNEERRPRSAEEMHAEAQRLAKEMETEPVD